jgi:hypothetical protein
MRAVPLNRGLALTTLDDVLPEIQRINESIQSILADIKSNTGKANIQTKDENKVKLKEIAKKLKELQTNMLSYYHPKKTTQLKLPENKLIKRKY